MLISIARADTNVSISVASTEDINIWANPNTPGETTYYLDGVNYKDTVNDLYENDMEMNYIFYKMSEMFIKFNPMKNVWGIRKNNFDTIAEKRFRWVMDNYFVPRTEVNRMMDELRAENLDLRLRIEAIEKILGDENVLKGRLNVAKDYDMDLTYGNRTYHNVDDGFITIQPVEQEAVEEPEEIVEEKPEQEDLLMEKWQELCDRGIKKFCLILE